MRLTTELKRQAMYSYTMPASMTKLSFQVEARLQDQTADQTTMRQPFTRAHRLALRYTPHLLKWIVSPYTACQSYRLAQRGRLSVKVAGGEGQEDAHTSSERTGWVVRRMEACLREPCSGAQASTAKSPSPPRVPCSLLTLQQNLSSLPHQVGYAPCGRAPYMHTPVQWRSLRYSCAP